MRPSTLCLAQSRYYLARCSPIISILHVQRAHFDEINERVERTFARFLFISHKSRISRATYLLAQEYRLLLQAKQKYTFENSRFSDIQIATTSALLLAPFFSRRAPSFSFVFPISSRFFSNRVTISIVTNAQRKESQRGNPPPAGNARKARVNPCASRAC